MRVLIIGAGVGGLTTAAVLAKAGLAVEVLEAHTYPGGCAGTFYHQGYHFEAGATLAGGFYPGGPMDLVAQATGVTDWQTRSDDLPMVVHLPDGRVIPRYSQPENHPEIDLNQLLGRGSADFWHWQNQTAEVMWNLALRLPPWPPQTMLETLQLSATGLGWLAQTQPPPHLFADAFRPVAAHLHAASPELRLFIDAQLLIAAQTTSEYANALYGASALDLPRRGVVHLLGGMGGIAQTLVETIRQHGGQVHYKQAATRVTLEYGRPIKVETKRRKTFMADVIVFNLTPWNVAQLLGRAAPRALRQLPLQPPDGWGAFMTYVGFDSSIVPANFPLHHQIIMRQPLAEGNTVFLSLSPAWDTGRAPAGQRVLTLSTHTALAPWWQLFQHDRVGYEARKSEYAARMITAAERILPGLSGAARLIMPGTPVTFQRFTRRAWGWVGGFPQTNLFRAWSPRLNPHVWLVGDTIFPGQSTAAVAMGGLRVARGILGDSSAQ